MAAATGPAPNALFAPRAICSNGFITRGPALSRRGGWKTRAAKEEAALRRIAQNRAAEGGRFCHTHARNFHAPRMLFLEGAVYISVCESHGTAAKKFGVGTAQ